MLGVPAQAHGERRDGCADHAHEQRDPVQAPRQAEVGSDVVERDGVAGGDEALPSHDCKDGDGKRQAEAPERRDGARREIVDGVDHDVLVAQEHGRQCDEKGIGEEELDQLVDAADRRVEGRAQHDVRDREQHHDGEAGRGEDAADPRSQLTPAFHARPPTCPPRPSPASEGG